MVEKSNVISFKTGEPVFTNQFRKKLENGIRPFVKEEEEQNAISALENIVCSSIVNSARNLAEMLVNKIFNSFK